MNTDGMKLEDLRPFVPFPKIPRMNREIVITEKIDGTNASVLVDTANNTVLAGSRTRWVTPSNDNFGWAKYVQDNRDMFMALGDGLHRGEWWGQGIQRGYGLDHRRFSLFNTSAWRNGENVPEGLFVVPMLGVYTTPDTAMVNATLTILKAEGSLAAPGFMEPEGLVIYHTAANSYFKVTCHDDATWKGNVG